MAETQFSLSACNRRALGGVRGRKQTTNSAIQNGAAIRLRKTVMRITELLHKRKLVWILLLFRGKNKLMFKRKIS